ncbi:MAG: MATE family efflux transporter [Eubacteriales bacterium]|nr:MATE family efflux transporter [Eubacteriales bacterium]
MSTAKNKTETKNFYRTLLVIVLPMTLQNLISAAVNSADVIMLGYVGQTAIAAASLANQIQFVLFLFYTGLSSGIMVMAAQYWGKKDSRAIMILLGMGLKLSLAVSFLFGLAAILAPQGLMRIFTNDTELIETGAVYLRVIGWSYFFMGISQVYECIIKSIERVKTATAIAGTTLCINILLNATFIFGLFGAPRLGILGVAIATLIARIVEVVICVADAVRQKGIVIDGRILTAWSAPLFTDFCKYSLPALGNEFLWGAGFSAYSIVLGHLGSDIVAANSVVSAARNLCTVFVFGVAYGAAIILGKEIGEGKLEQVKQDARRILWIVVWSSLAAGLVLIAIRPLIFSFTSLSETAYGYLSVMLYVNCPYILGMGLNTVMIAGLFRAGGDARFGLILDTIAMWVVFVPLAFLCGFVFKLPPLLVYIIICSDEFFKLPFNFFHYKKRNWVKNITREDAEL